MGNRERLLAAARRLAEQKPVAEITLADVAREAGVSWPTVRRHLVSRERLHDLLGQERPQPTAETGPDTRTRILAAADRVFAARGYSGASIDEVAADAGLTKGAVYWHFPSKNDLAVALMEQRIDQRLATGAGVAAAIAGSSTLRGGLETMFIHVLDRCFSDPTWAHLYVEFLHLTRDEAFRKGLSRLIERQIASMAGLTRQLQAAGVVAKDIDPDAVAAMLSAMFEGMLTQWVVDPERFDGRRWAGAMARILELGVAPKV